MRYLLLLIIIIFLCFSYFQNYTPLLIPVIYIIFSLLTVFSYAKDKFAAKKGTWRVSESYLHLMSLFSGWPGAILAQQLFRHKTIKAGFRTTFWITVSINFGALVWLHTNQGAIHLNTIIFSTEELVLNELGNSSIQLIILNLLSFHR